MIHSTIHRDGEKTVLLIAGIFESLFSMMLRYMMVADDAGSFLCRYVL